MIYEYRCEVCSTEFERDRPMSESSEPADCPSCKSSAPRILSAPSRMKRNWSLWEGQVGGKANKR